MEPFVKNVRPQETAVATARPVTINLTVMSNKLFNLPRASSQDVDDYTSLSDGTKISGFGTLSTDYESDVYFELNVTWHAEVNDPKGDDEMYPVELVSVNLVSSDLFGTNELYPDADGIISQKNEVHETKTDYTITFNILHRGQEKTFTLDPKLKANPRE